MYAYIMLHMQHACNGCAAFKADHALSVTRSEHHMDQKGQGQVVFRTTHKGVRQLQPVQHRLLMAVCGPRAWCERFQGHKQPSKTCSTVHRATRRQNFAVWSAIGIVAAAKSMTRDMMCSWTRVAGKDSVTALIAMRYIVQQSSK